MKIWLVRYKKPIIIGIIVLIVLLLILLVEIFYKLLLVDWSNDPEISTIINNVTSHLMITEWLALLGFIITLVVAVSVPLVFFIIGECHRKRDKKDSELQLDRMRQKDAEDRILDHLPVDLASSIIRYVYGNENDLEHNKLEFIEYNDIYVNNKKVDENVNISENVDINWNRNRYKDLVIKYDHKQIHKILIEVSLSKDNMQKTYEIIKTVYSFEKNLKYKMRYEFVKETLGKNVNDKDKFLKEIEDFYNEYKRGEYGTTTTQT